MVAAALHNPATQCCFDMRVLIGGERITTAILGGIDTAIHSMSHRMKTPRSITRRFMGTTRLPGTYFESRRPDRVTHPEHDLHRHRRQRTTSEPVRLAACCVGTVGVGSRRICSCLHTTINICSFCNTLQYTKSNFFTKPKYF